MTAAQPSASQASQFVMTMAARYGIDEDQLFNTLGSTAFRLKNGEVPTHAQMTALLVVANEYKLNPFTKEIYAYPDKGAVIPVVGVDGWVKIINSHKQYAGVEFVYSSEYVTMPGAKVPAPMWIDCLIHRKDLDKPVKVREFLDETYRTLPGPWQTHPKRLLRHKALIQCARVAFGFSGIYDQDEAERIIEAQAHTQTGNVVQLNASSNGQGSSMTAIPHLTDAEQAGFAKELAALIQRGEQLGSFAPCRAWVESLDNPAAQAYLYAELESAEQSWQARDAEQATDTESEKGTTQHVEPQASVSDSSGEHDDEKPKADLKSTVKQVIDKCLAANSFDPGRAWIKARLAHSETATNYALEQLEAAESEWKLAVAS